MNPSLLFLPCAAGVEDLLAAEVRALLADSAPKAATSVQVRRGGIQLLAGTQTAMRLNLGSRLASRVLWQVAAGEYRHEDDLYALGRSVAWDEWISPRQTLRVDCTAHHSPLHSLHFAALRIKDAVCDDLREATGERPNVDPRHADLSLVLHLTETHAALSVDLSGEALFKRGWREQQGEAPLKETLAAAMLAAAGWHGRAEDGLLLDPCCGAGTIAIEAAQMACGIAPGLQRRFGFERLRPFQAEARAWEDLREEAKAAVHAPAVAIQAGDVSFRMTDFATRNAERAGVLHAIDFKTADALQRSAPAEHGTLVLNPPYGERIDAKGTGSAQAAVLSSGAREGFEDGANADAFFSALASHWKKQFTGWTAWVLSPDPKLSRAMRLKESRRLPMWNGPIECRFYRFDLVVGSMRKERAAAQGGSVGSGAAGAPRRVSRSRVRSRASSRCQRSSRPWP